MKNIMKNIKILLTTFMALILFQSCIELIKEDNVENCNCVWEERIVGEPEDPNGPPEPVIDYFEVTPSKIQDCSKDGLMDGNKKLVCTLK